MDWDRTFVTQLFACCERATSLTTSLHLSILRPTEVLSAACCLMLVHLCYATARLLFELGFSGRSFQIPQYCCHSWVQNVPLYCNTAPAGPSLQLLYRFPPPKALGLPSCPSGVQTPWFSFQPAVRAKGSHEVLAHFWPLFLGAWDQQWIRGPKGPFIATRDFIVTALCASLSLTTGKKS